MPERFNIPIPKPGPFVLGPDSKERKPGVPTGTATKYEWRSKIFPGTFRDYWIYVPAQYSPDKPANVMVFQDGSSYLQDDQKVRAGFVFDNLIHEGRLPVTIGIFINAGSFPMPEPQEGVYRNRSFEYDSLGDLYARFLVEEMLPHVGAQYNLTQHASGRAICGASSGGICAFTAAWERPDIFSKVISHVGSFGSFRGGHLYPSMIRKTPRKPIRVYIQAGSEDLDIEAGHWPLLNLEVAAALNFAGYDYKLDYGVSAHGYFHAGATLPEALEWLWRPDVPVA